VCETECVRETVCVCERESVFVCVCGRERERVCVCVCVARSQLSISLYWPAPQTTHTHTHSTDASKALIKAAIETYTVNKQNKSGLKEGINTLRLRVEDHRRSLLSTEMLI